MKASDFKNGKPVKPKDNKPKGKKLDPIKVLKAAYAKPQKVARVGGKGYV
jgi:hypothetical protein|tara:strand:+ start:122 stop:271 length:150 start_codon:yes stop_codon:yes gene_type:complete